MVTTVFEHLYFLHSSENNVYKEKTKIFFPYNEKRYN